MNDRLPEGWVLTEAEMKQWECWFEDYRYGEVIYYLDSPSKFTTRVTANSVSAPLQATLVRLQNSSLCSQALGPPGSPFEMSAANRTFRDIGPFDRAIGQYRAHVEALMQRERV